MTAMKNKQRNGKRKTAKKKQQDDTKTDLTRLSGQSLLDAVHQEAEEGNKQWMWIVIMFAAILIAVAVFKFGMGIAQKTQAGSSLARRSMEGSSAEENAKHEARMAKWKAEHDQRWAEEKERQAERDEASSTSEHHNTAPTIAQHNAASAHAATQSAGTTGPQCTAVLYASPNYTGKILKSIVATAASSPMLTDKFPKEVEDKVSSIFLQGNCENVEVFDEDNCEQGHKDNINVNQSIPSFVNNGRGHSDLNNDVCRLRITVGGSATGGMKVESRGTRTGDCNIELFEDKKYGKKLGETITVKASASLSGQVVAKLKEAGKKVSSIKVSEGCIKVVAWDEDKCKEGHKDNLTITSPGIPSFPTRSDGHSDLNKDVCALQIFA